MTAVLEGFAGKAEAQANGLQPRPLAATGNSLAAEKAPKPEDFEFGQNFRLTVATPKTLSRLAKTDTEPRASDGKRSDISNRSLLTC